MWEKAEVLRGNHDFRQSVDLYITLFTRGLRKLSDIKDTHAAENRTREVRGKCGLKYPPPNFAKDCKCTEKHDKSIISRFLE